MRPLTSIFAATALALAMTAGAAMAQAPAPAPTAPAATPAPAAKAAAPKKARAPGKPRTAESLACSAEADQKGLKGKERQKFRKKCVADAKKAKAPAAPAKKG